MLTPKVLDDYINQCATMLHDLLHSTLSIHDQEQHWNKINTLRTNKFSGLRPEEKNKIKDLFPKQNTTLFLNSYKRTITSDEINTNITPFFTLFNILIHDAPTIINSLKDTQLDIDTIITNVQNLKFPRMQNEKKLALSSGKDSPWTMAEKLRNGLLDNLQSLRLNKALTDLQNAIKTDNIENIYKTLSNITKNEYFLELKKSTQQPTQQTVQDINKEIEQGKDRINKLIKSKIETIIFSNLENNKSNNQYLTINEYKQKCTNKQQELLSLLAKYKEFSELTKNSKTFLEIIASNVINTAISNYTTAYTIFNDFKTANDVSDNHLEDKINTIYNALITAKKEKAYESIKNNNPEIVTEEQKAKDYIIQYLANIIANLQIPTDLESNKVNERYLHIEQYAEKLLAKNTVLLSTIDFDKYRDILTENEANDLEKQLSDKSDKAMQEYYQQYQQKFQSTTNSTNLKLSQMLLDTDFYEEEDLKKFQEKALTLKTSTLNNFDDTAINNHLQNITGSAINDANIKLDISHEIYELTDLSSLRQFIKSISKLNDNEWSTAVDKYLLDLSETKQEILLKIDTQGIVNRQLAQQLRDSLTDGVKKIEERLKNFRKKRTVVEQLEKSTANSLEKLQNDQDITPSKCDELSSKFNQEAATLKQELFSPNDTASSTTPNSLLTTQSTKILDELNQDLIPSFNEFETKTTSQLSQLKQDAEIYIQVKHQFDEFKTLDTEQDSSALEKYRNKLIELITTINSITTEKLKDFLTLERNKYDTTIKTKLEELSKQIQLDSKIKEFSKGLEELISQDKFNRADSIDTFKKEANDLKTSISTGFNSDTNFNNQLDNLLKSATLKLTENINAIKETKIKNEQLRIAAEEETKALQKILEEFKSSSLNTLKDLNNPNTTIKDCEQYSKDWNVKKESIAKDLINYKELSEQLNEHWANINSKLTDIQNNITQHEQIKLLIEQFNTSHLANLQPLKDKTNLNLQEYTNHLNDFKQTQQGIAAQISSIHNPAFATPLNSTLDAYTQHIQKELDTISENIKQNEEKNKILINRINNLKEANTDPNKTSEIVYTALKALIKAKEMIPSIDPELKVTMTEQERIAKENIKSALEKEINNFSSSFDLEKNKVNEKYLNSTEFTDRYTQKHNDLLKKIDDYKDIADINDTDDTLKIKLLNVVEGVKENYERLRDNKFWEFHQKLDDFAQNTEFNGPADITTFKSQANDLKNSALQQFADEEFTERLNKLIETKIQKAKKTLQESVKSAEEIKAKNEVIDLIEEKTKLLNQESTFESIDKLHKKITTAKDKLQLSPEDKLQIDALYKKFGLEMINQKIKLYNQALPNRITDYKQDILKNINLFITQQDDFIKTNIPGDGNCLFSSIAAQFSDKNNQQIRQEVADYINNNWDEYKWYISEEDIKRATIGITGKVGAELTLEEQKKYIDYLKQDGTWGDQLSLIAASKIYNINVVVKSRNEDKYDAYISNKDATNTIYLEFDRTGKHYSALQLKDSVNKQLIQEIYTEFSSALAKKEVDETTKKLAAPALENLTQETFYSKRHLLAVYITRLSGLYSTLTTPEQGPLKDLEDLEDLKKKYAELLANSVAASNSINPSQETISTKVKPKAKPTITFRARPTATPSIQPNNSSTSTDFDPVLKKPAPVIGVQDTNASPLQDTTPRKYDYDVDGIVVGIPINPNNIDPIDDNNNSHTATPNPEYPANTTRNTPNITPNHSTNTTTAIPPHLAQTIEANKPSQKQKGWLRRAADTVLDTMTAIPNKVKNFYDNTINPLFTRTSKDPKLTNPKLTTEKLEETNPTITSYNIPPNVFAKFRADNTQEQSKPSEPTIIKALQEINSINVPSTKQQVIQRLSSIQNEFEEINNLSKPNANATTTTSTTKLKSELQNQITSLAELLKTIPTDNTTPNLNHIVKELAELAKKQDSLTEQSKQPLEKLLSLNNAIKQENTFTVDPNNNAVSIVSINPNPTDQTLQKSNDYSSTVFKSQPKPPSQPNTTSILSKVASQYDALLLHNVPQALMAARKTGNKATTPAVTESNITKDIFKKFCTNAKKQNEESKSNITALQEINNIIDKPKQQQIINQLSSIQNKFAEIKRKNFPKGNPLTPSPPEKTKLKKELTDQIQSLKELLVNEPTPNLNKIVTKLVNHAKHTSKKDNRALKSLWSDLNEAIKQDDFIYNEETPNNFTVVKNSNNQSDQQTTIEGTFDETTNKVKIMSSKSDPTDETIEEMIELANNLKNTAGDNKQQIEISGCEDNPEAAIKFYLYGKALELNPIIVDNDEDHTKIKVEDFIKNLDNNITKQSTKMLVDLYNEFKDQSPDKENIKKLLSELQQVEKIAVEQEHADRSSIRTTKPNT